MRVGHLHYKTMLCGDVRQAWEFFSSPGYLNAITPDFFHVTITSRLPEKIYAGLLICYRMKVVFGIPMLWVSEITQCDAPHRFVYQQRIGPFRFFSHEVCLTEKGDMFEIQDIVYYIMPFWFIGRLADRFFIGKRLQHIFEYRADKLEQIWGKK